MSFGATLEIFRDGELIKEQRISDESLLGREEGCVIRLEDRAISRRHAVIRPSKEGLEFFKKSQFGSLKINGRETEGAVLQQGDVVDIGPYLFKVKSLKFENLQGLENETTGALKPVPVPKKETPPVIEAVEPKETPEEIVEEPVAHSSSTQSNLEIDLPENTNIELGDFETPQSDSLEDAPDLGAEEEEVTEERVGSQTKEIQLSSPDELEGNFQDSPLIALPADTDEPSDQVAPLSFADETQQIEDDAATKILSNEEVRATLQFKHGDANLTEIEIGSDEITIGRSKKCDVILTDKKASRKNTSVRREGSRFLLKDLDSSNGTFLNGSRIESESDLAAGDEIRIASATFSFQAKSLSYEKNQDQFMSVPPDTEVSVPDFDLEMSTPDVDQGTPKGFSGEDDPTPLSPQAPLNSHPPELNSVALDLPGIQSQGNSSGKNSLIEQVKNLPKRKQLTYGLVLIALGLLYFDDSLVSPPKSSKKVKAVATQVQKKTEGKKDNTQVGRVFEALTPEQKRFVATQHSLAFDLYRNKEYDKSLFEIQKIFQLVDDYKNSREIERYAKEGKRKMEAIERERRRKEEEIRLKRRVATLLGDTKRLMAKKKYGEAEAKIPEILALDPENSEVARIQNEIDEVRELQRRRDEQRRFRAAMSREAQKIIEQAELLRQEGQWIQALEELSKIDKLDISDQKLKRLAAQKITEINEEVLQKLEPLLLEAKELEESGDRVAAYGLYEKADQVDPRDSRARQGMARIRDTLEAKAKSLYIEAVMAESFSDFEEAKKKFESTKKVAPKDSIYYERAQRKLKRYKVLSDGKEMEF